MKTQYVLVLLALLALCSGYMTEATPAAKLASSTTKTLSEKDSEASAHALGFGSSLRKFASKFGRKFSRKVSSVVKRNVKGPGRVFNKVKRTLKRKLKSTSGKVYAATKKFKSRKIRRI
eukprot:gene9461-1667_t